MKTVTSLIIAHPTTTLLIIAAASVWLITYLATRTMPAAEPAKTVPRRRQGRARDRVQV